MNRNYMLDTPQYALSNLPQPEDFNGDMAAYLAAVKAAYDADPNQSQPAFAAPGEFTTPDGQHMTSAGYHLDKSAAELAADAYNRILERNRFSQVKGPGVGLTAESRMGVRPEEAALAFGAYQLGPSGLPEALLNPYMQNLFEAMGMRPQLGPGAPGGMPGTQTPPSTSTGGELGSNKGLAAAYGPVLGPGGSAYTGGELGSNAGLAAAYGPVLGGGAGYTSTGDQQLNGQPPPIQTPVDPSTPWAPMPDSAKPLQGGGGPGVSGVHEYPPEMLARLKNHRSPTKKAGY